MAGALKVGELYVSLTANVSGFSKGLGEAIKQVGEASKKIKALSDQVASMSRTLVAPFLGAVAVAAQYDRQMERLVATTTGQMAALSVEMSKAAAPAVRDLNTLLGGVTRTLRAMTPAQKEQVSHFVEMAAKAAGVAMIVSKAAGLIGGMSDVIAPLIRAFATPQVFAFVAALLAVVAALGLMKMAWDKWGDSIEPVLDKAIVKLKGLGDAITAFIAKAVTPQIDKDAAFFRTPQQMNLVGPGGDLAKAFIPQKDTAVGEGRDVLNHAKDDAKEAGGVAISPLMEGAKLMAGWMTTTFAPVSAMMNSLQGNMDLGAVAAPKQLLTVAQWLGKSGDRTPNTIDASNATAEKTMYADQAALGSRIVDGERIRTVSKESTRDSGYKLAAHFDPATPVNVAGAEKALEDIREAGGVFALRLKETLSAAAAHIGEVVLTSSGAFGSALSAVLKGAAEGGPMGAITAGITELLERSAGFQTLMGMLATIGQTFADGMGKVLVPLEPVLGAVSDVFAAITRCLEPLNVWASALELLAPIVEMVGMVLGALSPLFDMLGGLLKAIMVPITWLLTEVLKVVFGALKGVGIILLGITMGLAYAWNAILDGIETVLRAIGLKDWAADLDTLKADTAGMSAAMTAMVDSTWEGMAAKAAESAAAVKLAGAATGAAAALSNVPSSYNIALARYNAARGVASAAELAALGGGTSSSSSSSSGPSPVFGTQQQAQTPAVVVNVTLDGKAIRANVQAAERVEQRTNGRTSARVDPRYAFEY